MAACIPASLAGVRVFTATASQGLLLMHELLHYAAGARAPIVMVNVNRTVASPWAFWPDQTDSLSQRDTGWIQFYSESAQESLDTTIQCFRVAEAVPVPGFGISAGGMYWFPFVGRGRGVSASMCEPAARLSGLIRGKNA